MEQQIEMTPQAPGDDGAERDMLESTKEPRVLQSLSLEQVRISMFYFKYPDPGVYFFLNNYRTDQF